MSDKFDPYYRWLGIPPREQPPNHYRLLGVELFESDPQLIDSFALRHTSFLREIADGPHLQDAQQLLNELAAARRCLLNPSQKAAYDAELRERLAADKRLPNAAAAKTAQAATPTADPAVDARRQVPSPDVAPVIAITPRNESRISSARRGSRRSQAGSTRTSSGSGSKRPDSPARKTSAFPLGAHLRRVISSGTEWLASRHDRRRVGLLAGGLALLLVVIGMGAAVLFRTAPPRRAVSTAVGEESGRTSAAAEPAAEQEPRATPLPEPSAEPAGDDSFVAAPSEQPDGSSAKTAAMNPLPELPAAASEFIADGQPPRLAGLALWLDASQLTAADGRITRWNDAGGEGYTARPKQKTEQPEVLAQALGGKNVARFRGGQRLEISRTSQTFNLGCDYTIVYVSRGVAGTLLSKGVGTKTGQFSLQGDSCFLTNGELNAANGGRLAAVDDDPAQFRVRTIVANTTALNWFLNGTASGSYSGDRYEIQSTSVVWIGSPWFRAGQEDPSQFFVGDLAELVIYNRALPESEREGIEAYLREKWLSGDAAPALLDLVPPPVVEPAASSPAEKQRPRPPGKTPADDESVAEPAAPSAAESQPAEPAGNELFHLCVNLGGNAWQDPAGHEWVPSKKFDGATFGHEAGQSIKSDAVEHPMYGTAVRALVGFRAIVPNGDYAIELHFHEHWSRNPTDRAFAVAIEQVPVLRPPMFFQGPGMGQPYVHKIGKVTVKDGRLDVDLVGIQPGSLAILNGIEIRQLR